MSLTELLSVFNMSRQQLPADTALDLRVRAEETAFNTAFASLVYDYLRSQDSTFFQATVEVRNNRLLLSYCASRTAPVCHFLKMDLNNLGQRHTDQTL